MKHEDLGVNEYGLFHHRITYEDGFVSDVYFTEEVTDVDWVTKMGEQFRELKQHSYSVHENTKKGFYIKENDDGRSDLLGSAGTAVAVG